MGEEEGVKIAPKKLVSLKKKPPWTSIDSDNIHINFPVLSFFFYFAEDTIPEAINRIIKKIFYSFLRLWVSVVAFNALIFEWLLHQPMLKERVNLLKEGSLEWPTSALRRILSIEYKLEKKNSNSMMRYAINVTRSWKILLQVKCWFRLF